MAKNYIKADELCNYLVDHRTCDVFNYANMVNDSIINALLEYIDQMPEPDVVERTRGKWEVCGTFDDFLKCSCCGYKKPWNEEVFNFCPSCGAEMEKANETPPNIYECDPNKNTECTKESCFINGGPCCLTVYEEFKKEEPDGQ